MKKARPKYKALYLAEFHARQEVEDLARLRKDHLDRLQRAMAPKGREIMESIPREGRDPISLNPLDYECLAASMLDCQRFSNEPMAEHEDVDQLCVRARRVFKVQA